VEARHVLRPQEVALEVIVAGLQNMHHLQKVGLNAVILKPQFAVFITQETNSALSSVKSKFSGYFRILNFSYMTPFSTPTVQNIFADGFATKDWRASQFLEGNSSCMVCVPLRQLWAKLQL
jgi:hypothetical protein